MRHHTREELDTVAGIHRDADHHPLTRDERVARWAELLEQDPDRALVTLQETEYQPDIIRDEMREDGSPITIAFKDPVLRGEGLTNATAKRKGSVNSPTASCTILSAAVIRG